MADGSAIIGSAISSDEEEEENVENKCAEEEEEKHEEQERDLPSPDDLTEKSAASETEPSEKAGERCSRDC